MLRFNLYIVWFVFFATVKSKDINKIMSDIATHVEAFQTTTPYIVNVTFDQLSGSDIFMYEAAHANDLRKIEKTDILFTSFGCTFAQWTLNKIYDFVKDSPMFKSHQLEISPNDEGESESQFNENFSAFINTIQTEVALLIDILNNLLNAITAMNLSYYKDTSILEALMSLRMNIYFLSLNDNGNQHVSRCDIFRIVTKDMTAIQNYLSVNCSKQTSEKDIQSIYFGYWIYKNNLATVDESPFIHFSKHILKLKSDNDFECSPTQTILEDFIKLSTDFTNLARTKVNVNNGIQANVTTISIEDLYDHMKKSYDIGTVFLYQDSVVAAIMKCIVSEILKGLREDASYINHFKTLIRNIYHSVSENELNLPEYFVNGFTILFSYNAERKVTMEELQSFHDSLARITLVTNIDQPKRLEYLTKILSKISENIMGFKCFQQTYKCLQDKHNRHYLPFINEIVNIAQTTDVEYFKKVYDFLIIVYTMCFQVNKYLIHLYDSTVSCVSGFLAKPKINDANYPKMYGTLKHIRHYIFLIIKKGTRDIVLLQMAFDIMSILANVPLKPKNVYKFYVERFIDIIMKILMKKGLQYCVPQNCNCLLHRHINSFDLNDKNLIKTTVANFFFTNVQNFTEDHLDIQNVCETDYNHFNIKYLYDNYIKSSNVIVHYEQCIQFTWKERPYTISNMFIEAKLDFLYPLILHTLYDVFFKFYISIIYYLMKKVMLSMNFNIIRDKFKKISTNYHLNVEYFPRIYKPFILDIISLLKLSTLSEMDEKENMIQLTKHTKKIDKLLNKFNIILNLSKTCKFKNNLFGGSLHTTFNNELNLKVKQLNDTFKKLIIFRVFS